MRAAVFDAYGGADVIQVREIPDPQPAPGQVRIRVRAHSVNPLDWKIRSGALKMVYRQTFPAGLGFDVAGEIDALGEGVSGFSVGERVYSRLPGQRGAACAQLACAPIEAIAPSPTSLTDAQAAAIPLAGLTALQALRELGELQSGQRVLVNGASGGVGTFGVQIAKALGAHVTAVCSERNHALVRELGADAVIDYRSEDFTESGQRWDVVFDAVANQSYRACSRVMNPKGRMVTTLPSPGVMFWQGVTSVFGGKRVRFIAMRPDGEGLRYLAGLADGGQLRAIVDSTFSLDQIREAHARSETGRARGKIVVSIP